MNWNLSVMSGNSFGTYAEKLANKIQSKADLVHMYKEQLITTVLHPEKVEK